MLDVSRGQIPTLETLYSIVDFLSDLKYNQLQLYVEGFSYSYPSFKNLPDKTGGLDQSMESIKKLQVQFDEQLELLNKISIATGLTELVKN